MLKFLKCYEVDVVGSIFAKPRFINAIASIRKKKKKQDPFKHIFRLSSKDKFIKRKKRTLHGVRFKNQQLLKYFYNVSYSRYKRVLLFIKRSKGVANFDRFHTILEGELATVLWRSSFFMSILQVKKYIRAGFVFINGVMVQKPNFVLSPGDIITFDKYCLFNILRNILYRIKTKRLFRFDKNIEVNYNNFTIFYIRNLKLGERPFIFGDVHIRKVPYV